MRVQMLKVWFLLITLALFAGCGSSSTSNNEDADGNNDIFDSGTGGSGGGSGSVSLDVNDDDLPVGQTTGFHFTVRDAGGSGVTDIRIACDSEQGVAIIEPNSGFENTDSNGGISGVIGCELPGSFRFGCRVPVGGGRREFTTVKCRGEIPPGFSGFPGAAGGGLGGGVSDDGQNGDVEVTQVSFIEVTGDDATTSIDISQGACGVAPDLTAEPFGDTSVKFKVVNNTNSEVRFTKMSYSVDNFDGAGNDHDSSDISLLGSADAVAASEGGTAEFQALFMDAVSGGKRFAGASVDTPAIGFRNITFRVTGRNALGETVVLTVRAAASFDDYNNCSS